MGMFLGSIIGGYVPMIWGDGGFSFSSIILTATGGILGIWGGHKLSSF